MAENIFVNDLQDFGKSLQDKGDQWLKTKEQDLENWAKTGAKDKLLAEAKQHGVSVDPNMNPEEIKNKILEKIRA